ncbi:LPS assembly lipoprotein LptE [Devosia sp.]|uniref:LPS assembly lipoprotein LptE n=1 Tax=Devosia sp. TaxID=1871048 RepID=UPI002619BE0F|nr:LPS assembly lipoprotein LptE [Devosia sp.]
MSKPLFRNVFVALTLVGATGLAGCTGLTPVYGERGIGTERHPLNYADPQNRLDQIIYQELVLRFGRATDPASPTVRITTSSDTRRLTRSNVERPSEQREARVKALIELVAPDGSILLSTTRSAAALYTIDSQVLAETEAEREALERAARELAETVRLTLLGALSQTAT